VFIKTAEACFAEADPPYLGLKMADIGTAGRYLLAEKLLEHRDDPDPKHVRLAAPPLGSTQPQQGQGGFAPRLPWNTFVGTKECFDTMPVYPGGNTRTYHPSQYFTELRAPGISYKRHEGLLGGWMPAVRKVLPISENAYIELLI